MLRVAQFRATHVLRAEGLWGPVSVVQSSRCFGSASLYSVLLSVHHVKFPPGETTNRSNYVIYVHYTT